MKKSVRSLGSVLPAGALLGLGAAPVAFATGDPEVTCGLTDVQDVGVPSDVATALCLDGQRARADAVAAWETAGNARTPDDVRTASTGAARIAIAAHDLVARIQTYLDADKHTTADRIAANRGMAAARSSATTPPDLTGAGGIELAADALAKSAQQALAPAGEAKDAATAATVGQAPAVRTAAEQVAAAARQVAADATGVLAVLGERDTSAGPLVRDALTVAGDAEGVALEAVKIAEGKRDQVEPATTVPTTSAAPAFTPAPQSGGGQQVTIKPKGAPETGGGVAA